MRRHVEPGVGGEGTAMPARPPGLEFSLCRGGPLFTLLKRAQLLTSHEAPRGLLIGLAMWVPLAVGEGARLLWGLTLSPLVLDISVHTRLLVALPVLLLSERALDAASRSSVHSLCNGGFCDRAALERVVRWGERLRDARWPELLFAVAALVAGQLTLWQVLGATGVFSGAREAGVWSFPRVWYAAVALPVMQFVLLRWLWRWVIWSLMLVRVAGLKLDLVASHPDHAAGLSCASKPMPVFSAFAVATSAILAGVWGTQILAKHETAPNLAASIITLVVALTVLAVGPQLFFSGHLYWARRKGVAQYADFSTEYARAFQARWLTGRGGAQALGAWDIQAFNDLAGTYSTVSKTRLVTFGVRALAAIWAGALAPLAPLFLSGLKAEQILKKLISAVFSGLPI